MCTREFLAPGTHPLTPITEISLFTSSSGTFFIETFSFPQCPCIFFHLCVLRGFLVPIEPSALWNFEP